jgi:hypothetical protein
MYVDDNLRGAGADKTVDGAVEEGAPVYFYEGFGAVVGERFEACAQSRGKYHGFHVGETVGLRSWQSLF